MKLFFTVFLSRIERSSNNSNDGDGLLNFFRSSILHKIPHTSQKLKKTFWFLLVRTYLFVRYTCVGEVFFEWTPFVFASRLVSFAILLCDEPPSPSLLISPQELSLSAALLLLQPAWLTFCLLLAKQHRVIDTVSYTSQPVSENSQPKKRREGGRMLLEKEERIKHRREQ